VPVALDVARIALSALALSGCASHRPATLAQRSSPRVSVAAPRPAAPSIDDIDRPDSALFEAASSACVAGSIEACVTVAERLIDGRGVSRSLLAAKERLDVLCTADARRACALLARVDLWSLFPESVRTARLLAERECSRGESTACIALSDARALGLGGPIELAGVEAPLADRCDAGAEDACAALVFSRVSRDRSRAAPDAAALCARGHARGCLASALVTTDVRSALVALERACSLGDGRGCALAAERYRQGPLADPARAERLATRGCLSLVPSSGCWAWLSSSPTRFDEQTRGTLAERACQFERVSSACVDVVRAGLRQSGFDRPPMAMIWSTWLAPSCDAGAPWACGALGALEGTWPRSVDRAIEHLRFACDRDDAFACASLGVVLNAQSTRGFEVEALWRRACEAGEPLGCSAFVRARAPDNTSGQARRAELFEIAARGCALDDGECCVAAAERAPSPEAQRRLENRACQLGQDESCVRRLDR